MTASLFLMPLVLGMLSGAASAESVDPAKEKLGDLIGQHLVAVIAGNPDTARYALADEATLSVYYDTEMEQGVADVYVSPQGVLKGYAKLRSKIGAFRDVTCNFGDPAPRVLVDCTYQVESQDATKHPLRIVYDVRDAQVARVYVDLQGYPGPNNWRQKNG